MKKVTFARGSAAYSLAAAVFYYITASITGGATAQASNTPATDPRLDMVSALKASGPHPSLGDHAKDLSRLVGNWDVEYTDISKDGKVTHRTGEFIVGWVLDGRAIQDVWIVNPSGTRKDREVYTDLRYYDSKSQTWPATFIDPEHVSVARFAGGAADEDRIVLNTKDFDGTETRWSFDDIRPDSFIFRDQASSDGGKTWRLQSEYHMKRHGKSAMAQ